MKGAGALQAITIGINGKIRNMLLDKRGEEQPATIVKNSREFLEVYSHVFFGGVRKHGIQINDVNAVGIYVESKMIVQPDTGRIVAFIVEVQKLELERRMIALQISLAPIDRSAVDIQSQIVDFSDDAKNAVRKAPLATADVQYPALLRALKMLDQSIRLMFGGLQIEFVILEFATTPPSFG
jgi:hypothetical protein